MYEPPNGNDLCAKWYLPKKHQLEQLRQRGWDHRKEPSPPTATEVQVDSQSEATSSVREQESATASVVAKVINWEQCNLSPPREILSDNESEASSFDFAVSNVSSKGRPSMLFAPSGKRKGVEMDVATKLANEMLQKGKEALEQACKIKREHKTTALESLAGLYEIVLSLSDSRSRHRCNLEKERSRHATELMRVERAHTKHLNELNKQLAGELGLARKDLAANLAETKAIRDWQGYETQEPHRLIKETAEAIADLKQRLKMLNDAVATQTGHTTSNEPLLREHAIIKIGVETIKNQVDELRRDVHKEAEKASEIHGLNIKMVGILESQPPNEIKPDNCEMGKVLEILSKIDSKRIPESLPQPVTVDLKEQFQPITETLEAVKSELRTMREEKLRIPPPSLSLEAEMCLAEGEKRAKKTYAKVAALPPPPPRPNHTLIISSSDQNQTGDNLIDRIAVALDTKKTGAKVDRIRKAKNQKVVLSCGTSEDLNLIHKRVQMDKGLRVQVAKAGNPLIIIKDVLKVHTDAEIVEHLLAQNKQLLQGQDLKECTMKVRYRKKARNTHECHPVLEVSPLAHKRLIEAGKVYIGLQRRPVADQSPLVQCTKCLGFGHTKAICRETEDLCSHCGGKHTWEKCQVRLDRLPPTCKNCSASANGERNDLSHNAFSSECPERTKWDAIARSRISYC
ncbi:uncharacterized protein LOC125490052 [Plutella xylostella]|uniref:uncharacterized protein LOC125490052 n=1 Tax=Plutella xylostella TaxID=51655 RepID=UPI002032F2EA|nr:uncharacterized protein LOC125490052 [Plutella xylostella]